MARAAGRAGQGGQGQGTSSPLPKPRGLTVDFIRDPVLLQDIVRGVGQDALYAPFRRGVFNPDLAIHAKTGKKEYWVGAETDSSFGHAKVDMLTPPVKDDRAAGARVLREGAARRAAQRQETASVFALCAADWTLSNQVYSELGFKVTARLTDHITRADEFVGAQLCAPPPRQRRRAQAEQPARLIARIITSNECATHRIGALAQRRIGVVRAASDRRALEARREPRRRHLTDWGERLYLHARRRPERHLSARVRWLPGARGTHRRIVLPKVPRDH